MKKKPEILSVSTIAQTRIFRVERLNLRFANGHEASYERLYASPTGAVLIVPLLNQSTVLLVREYAAGVDRYELSLPKGRIDSGESMFEAANRELMEEVGYGAGTLQHIKSVTLAPGYVGHATHILLATDLYAEKRAGDEPEEIEVIPWSLDQLPALLTQAECTEARTIAALFMVRERLSENAKALV
ncbi:MAG: ADP compounds hydrolase NudE [Acidiferrobacterales bacterium]